MKTFVKSLLITTLPFLILLTSCSKKDEVVLDPADQVVGTYAGQTYTETVSGVSQSYDLTSAALKDNIIMKLVASKQDASTIKLDLSISQKDSLGTMQTTTSALEGVALVALSTGGYQMQSDSQSIGQIVDGTLTVEQTFADIDSKGNAIQVTAKIVAKKE